MRIVRMSASLQPRRLLIVRPSALGDVCRSVPVLVSLKRAFPEAVIDWVVRDTFVDAVAAHPDLGEVVPFPRAELASWWRNPSAARAAWRWFSDLRHRGYDLVFDMQGLWRSGLITFSTGARERVGFRGARELAWLGYNTRHPRPAGAHTVDEMLALLAAHDIEPVRDLQLYVPGEAQQWWVKHQQELGLTDTPYTVLAPTARWGSKRWPIERWQELAVALRDRGHERLIIVGAPGEETQVRELVERSEASGSPMINLVGRTSVGGMMAIIAGATLVLATDSAPLHLAVGFDRPCVGLFGPTDPELVGPYQRPDAVVQNPDENNNGHRYRDRKLGDALMRQINVDDVLERIAHVLAPGSRSRGE